MRILPSSVHAWLHEGEQGALEIYRYLWIPICLGLVLLGFSPAVYLGSRSRPLLTGAIVLIYIGVIVMCWQRKVAILMPTAVLFRPIVGKPFQVSLIGAKRVSEIVLPGGEGDSVICRLEFIVGGFIDFPGGYWNGSVLLARMEEIIAERAKADGGVGSGPGGPPHHEVQ